MAWRDGRAVSGALIRTHEGVTLAGAGAFTAAGLRLALGHAPHLVAADGGADRVMRHGHTPRAVIGDLDSLSDGARTRLGARVHHLPDQDSTDFDKALRSIDAPFVIALGFTGGRLDHTLGAFNTLARHPARRCVLLAGGDLCFVAPRALDLGLRRGMRLSLFPMGAVSGRSTGLRWPIDGLDFAPDAVIGTSNEVTDPDVALRFSGRGMLVILPRGALGPVLAALGAARG